jgi:hypothetical protein
MGTVNSHPGIDLDMDNGLRLGFPEPTREYILIVRLRFNGPLGIWTTIMLQLSVAG